VGQVIDAAWLAERDRLLKETYWLLPQVEPETILP
jgi:hypothetical protein